MPHIQTAVGSWSKRDMPDHGLSASRMLTQIDTEGLPMREVRTTQLHEVPANDV